MKLKQISTDTGQYRQFRRLFGESAVYRPDYSVPYLFIESVIASGVLTEAGQGRLSALFNAGMAKLKNLLTPGAEDNLSILLMLTNPKAKGDDVKNLIQQASAVQGSLADDQNWWARAFDIFLVKDPQIQEAIRAKVRREVQPQQPPADPTTAGPGGESAGDEAGGMSMSGVNGSPRGRGGSGGGGGLGGGLGDLGAEAQRERDATMASSDELRGMMGDIRKQREAAMARLRELHAMGVRPRHQRGPRGGVGGGGRPGGMLMPLGRGGFGGSDDGDPGPPRRPGPAMLPAHKPQVADLLPYYPKGPTEGVLAEIAAELLNESCVRSNLRFVASHMIRRVGSPHTIPLEEGWFSNLTGAIAQGAKRFMRGAGNFLANPEYAKEKLSGSASANDNQRAAKLAIQLLTDHLKVELNSKLRMANLTLPDTIKTIRLWDQLQAKYKQGNRDPKFMEIFKQTLEKLKQILFAVYPQLAQAFNTGAGTTAESRQIVGRFGIIL